MPTTDDEIQEKYLERAIRELNQLTHQLQECSHCPRGNLMPVLGSGHPQADIFLQMVQQAYPPIHRHKSFEFGEARSAGGRIAQRVHIVDDNGEAWEAMYTLEQQPDVYFEAGDHKSLVHMDRAEFSRVTEGARHGQFSEPSLVD